MMDSVVKAAADGFAEDTPASWKPKLTASTPCPAIVDRYMQLCEIGRVTVPVHCFEPHVLQRELNDAHVEKLAQEIRGSNQHRDYPCLVIAQQEPELKPRWDDKPFVLADGSPVKVLTLRGNHRVNALRKALDEAKEEGEIMMEEGWYSIVLHPCFQIIHSDHVRRLIVRDNIERESARTILAETHQAHVSYALGIYVALHKAHGETAGMMKNLDEELAHLELFKQGWSKEGPTSRWKLGLRSIMRDPRATAALQKLLETPGTLHELGNAELGRFLVNLGQKGRGVETMLGLLLRAAVTVQKRLNKTHWEDYPGGFNLMRMWEDAAETAFMDNEALERSQRLERVPTVEQEEAWENALHYGRWGELLECFPGFAQLFRMAKVEKSAGEWVGVGRAPNVHLACISTAKHDYNGWWIENLNRCRVGARTLCLMLFGPEGVRGYSDPPLKRILFSPKMFLEQRAYLMHERLTEWLLRKKAVSGETEETQRTAANVQIESTMAHFGNPAENWAVPDEIWEDISNASMKFFGADGEPQSEKSDIVPRDTFPSIARIANRILGIPGWHEHLVKVWKLIPGEPFPWEATVNVTILSPEEIQAAAVRAYAEGVARQEEKKAKDSLRRMEKKVGALTKKLSLLETEQAEGNSKKFADKLEALEEERQNLYEQWDEEDEDLREQQEAEAKRIAAEIEAVEAKRQKLEKKKGRQEDLIEELVREGLTTEELVGILEKKGIKIDSAPFSGDSKPRVRDVSPPIPTQGTPEDIVEVVREVFHEAAALLPWEVREQLALVAMKCARGGGVGVRWMEAMVKGLEVPQEALSEDALTDPTSGGTPRQTSVRARSSPATPAAGRARKKSRQVSPTPRGKADVISDESDEELPRTAELLRSFRRHVPPPRIPPHEEPTGKVLVPSSSVAQPGPSRERSPRE